MLPKGPFGFTIQAFAIYYSCLKMLTQRSEYTIKAVKQDECHSAFALFHGPLVLEIAVRLSADEAVVKLL
jgi:hypothetical protein